MKTTLFDKILIGLSILLYILGYFFGGWSIIFNLFLLLFIINLITKSYSNGNLATNYLIFIIIFILLNIIIKLGYFLDMFKNYSLKNKAKIETNNLQKPTPTPTIYKCPVINFKTEEDIKYENAEKNLSSYSYIEKYDDGQGNFSQTREITVKILEKILLPCDYYNENYCQLRNGDAWIMKYPRNWRLYRIKKEYSTKPFTYFDLKFENESSYFYLAEITTLGGNPIIIKHNQWNYLKKYCQEMFYSNYKDTKNYICYGNVLGCSSNMEGYFGNNYSINSYYKSFIQVNSKVQENETLIDNWYIPSIHFEENNEIKALRAYIFSRNFYSNDEQFISELKKIYKSLYERRYLTANNFTQEFIESIKERPKEWEKADKLTADKMAYDLIRLCVRYPDTEETNKDNLYCDFNEYWTNNRTGEWELLGRYYAGQEGPLTCEQWEKWKVAKGMDCRRWNGSEWDFNNKVSY